MNGSLFSNGQSVFSATQDEDTDVNLISLLSIMANMLFFLLISFGVGLIALVSANVPTITEENTVIAVSKTKITSTLAITGQGMSVTASNEMMVQTDLDKLKRRFPKTKDGYDFKALNDYMYFLKREFKDSDTVVITPDPEIPYDTLVKAMDATREIPVTIEGRVLRYPLFPAAVISTLVK